MKRLKKSYFLRGSAAVLILLAAIRFCFPQVMGEAATEDKQQTNSTDTIVAPAPAEVQTTAQPTAQAETEKAQEKSVAERPIAEKPHKKYHPIGSLHSYEASFPDVQDVQIVAAKRLGVPAVSNRKKAEEMKDRLVYVGANPYFVIDNNLTSSIPYLVPEASKLVGRIGRNFIDSLYVRGVPMHKIIVSSVLRSDEDVARLRKTNPNATEQSCHRHATTVDICYNRYVTVSPPGGPRRRTVQDDTLKWVLSQVLRDLREEGACYVKYEKRQGCFHLTVR